jgi:hypothetical protein
MPESPLCIGGVLEKYVLPSVTQSSLAPAAGHLHAAAIAIARRTYNVNTHRRVYARLIKGCEESNGTRQLTLLALQTIQ